MKTIKSYFKEHYKSNDEVTSITMVTTDAPFSPLIDGFDVLILVISKHRREMNITSHYIKDSMRIQERWIHKQGLESWILNGENRSIIQWILHGEILLDKELYLEGMRHRLLEAPQQLREKKIFIEFSLFLRKYLQAKDYSKQNQALDAYSSVMEALQHWARIAIIESGHQPEVMVWKQLKQINPGVYKLFEELTLSSETIEQRAELVLLACEFSVMSKMKECCQILFRVLDSRAEPWSVNELKYHPELIDTHVELALVLNKLHTKSLIEEVVVAKGQSLADPVIEIRYKSLE